MVSIITFTGYSKWNHLNDPTLSVIRLKICSYNKDCSFHVIIIHRLVPEVSSLCLFGPVPRCSQDVIIIFVIKTLITSDCPSWHFRFRVGCQPFFLDTPSRDLPGFCLRRVLSRVFWQETSVVYHETMKWQLYRKRIWLSMWWKTKS